MIISEKTKKIRLCKSENPLVDIFEDLKERKIKNQIQNGIPIYFTRLVGLDDSREYVELIKNIKIKLTLLSDPSLFVTKGLDKHLSNLEVERFTEIWLKLQSWYNDNDSNEVDLFKLNLENDVGLLNWEYKCNFIKILAYFDSIEKNINTTIKKNFGIMILAWSSRYLNELFQNDTNSIPKIIYYGQIKRNEVYFLIFASFFGCDILFMNPEEDKEFSRIDPNCIYSITKYLSRRISFDKIKDPFLNENYCINNQKKVESKEVLSTKIENMFIQSGHVQSEVTAVVAKEKSYEELAVLSASIVMIKIYKHDFFQSGNGSGVVIDDNGLILTNYHVVKEGGIFGIVFENDEREYTTSKLVAYNEASDLALIRIILKTTPVPIYRDNKLRRGQQIVAIGSPLGLMNTISDGIIAGFRKYNELDYIQITAPMSPGSSGGALLDRNGYLIGITTAGFADGQNLNLAVPISELFKMYASNNL